MRKLKRLRKMALVVGLIMLLLCLAFHSITPFETKETSPKNVAKTSKSLEMIRNVDRAVLESFFDEWKFGLKMLEKPSALNDQYRLSNLIMDAVVDSENSQLVDMSDRESIQGFVKSIKSYKFDPRLTFSLFYRKMSELGTNDKVGFSWQDWKKFDLTLSQDGHSEAGSHRISCQDIFEEEVLPQVDEIQQLGETSGLRKRNMFDPNSSGKVKVATIEDVCKDDKDSEGILGFTVKKIVTHCNAKSLQLQSAGFLMSGHTHPSSLFFLLDGKRHIHVDVKQAQKSNGMLQNGYLDSFVEMDSSMSFDATFDASKELGFLQSKINFTQPSLELQTTDFKDLPLTAFQLDEKAVQNKIATLTSRDRLTNSEQGYLNFLKNDAFLIQESTFKYFQETSNLLARPDIYQDNMDARFFSGYVTSKWDRMRTLNALIRGWLEFSSQINISSWISQESLRGHMYTGSQLPWSTLHDVHMPIKDLHYLAEKFNQTLVVQSATIGYGRYFIDIHPFISSREKGSGANVVDARFIDVDTGFFVNIKGLGLDGEVDVILQEMKTNPEPNTMDKNQRKMSVMARNGRHYQLSDLLPLRPSRFHGLPVHIPSRSLSLLQEEYELGPYFFGPKLNVHKQRVIPALNGWVELSTMKRIWGIKMTQTSHEMSRRQLHRFAQKLLDGFPDFYEDLVYWINSRKIFEHRLKEISLEFSDLEMDLKTRLLQELTAFPKELESPFADPFTFKLQEDRWYQTLDFLRIGMGSDYQRKLVHDILYSKINTLTEKDSFIFNGYLTSSDLVRHGAAIDGLSPDWSIPSVFKMNIETTTPLGNSGKIFIKDYMQY
ncbi:LAMI_0G02784g1_1 [Lachancea mirantina]|uniref:LAMI_0G02784g1_1 n=1 Tax=Lachancea mirantina TaxID=1230905 RepID=A0A1G4K806_9SACH|nr:LAMI_0G02784g1_1 [Lachancea mirantina]